MIRDFWCPKCKKKGLHPYDKDGARPFDVDKITYLWCLYCDYRIGSEKKRERKVGVKRNG